jgi:outer membrane lipase/esterase
MRQTNFALAIIAAAVLAGCGGSTGGDQTLKNKFSAQVSFGDSLSDVGTYAVGPVAALGGGKFNINGDNTGINPALTGKNWTELMAVQFGLPAPCAAQTGLDGGPGGFNVPVVNHPGCFGYAQGGARVTIPVGPGNKATGVARGDLTVPVVTQIQNHLKAVGGKFKGDEIVFVMAGGNDALIQLATLSAGATAAGQAAGAAEGARVGAATFATNLVGLLAAGATDPAAAAQAIGLALANENARPGHTDQTVVGAAVAAAAAQPGNQAVGSPAVFGPMVASAQAAATAAGTAAGAAAGAKAGADFAAANGPKAVVALATAGAELVALVKTELLANGASKVVVNNLPDIATTPAGLATSTETQQLIAAMSKAFNDQLSNGLAGEPNVLLVDVFAVSHDQATNPGPYGLTNVKDTACDLTPGTPATATTPAIPAKNPLGNSLGCNGTNLIPGDVSHYSFADSVHPTPFNYLLLARYVSKFMVVKGWL